jgi:hypothetical protein
MQNGTPRIIDPHELSISIISFLKVEKPAAAFPEFR